jgi:hypothetical protein
VRQLPSTAPRALADTAHGHALAALRCAAERVFLRDLDLALDAEGERDQHIELGRLALCGGAASPTDLSDVLAASLDVRVAA